MRFVTYVSAGRPTVGLLDAQDRVHDVADLLGEQGTPSTAGHRSCRSDRKLGSAAHGCPTGRAAVGFRCQTVQLLAPFPRPRRNIFCVGKNYREHAREFGERLRRQQRSGD